PSLYAQPGLLMAWHTSPVAPWQTESWIEAMRATLRPSAFLRMIQNVFASSESVFVEPAWWAACEDATLHPVLADPRLAVWIGVDASVRRGRTALRGGSLGAGEEGGGPGGEPGGGPAPGRSPPR